MPTEVSPLVLARESNDELPESTPPTSLDYRWHPNTIYLIIINVIGIVGILTSYGGMSASQVKYRKRCGDAHHNTNG
jgi:hypothetical protein